MSVSPSCALSSSATVSSYPQASQRYTQRHGSGCHSWTHSGFSRGSKSAVFIALILLLGAWPAVAQPAPYRAAEVAQILSALPPAVESATDDARRANLFAIARQLNARGDCCWGVLVKTDQGNKIPADILVWRPTLEHFDVMSGSNPPGAPVNPTWDPKGIVPNGRWMWQAAPDGSLPDPPQSAPPPSPSGSPAPIIVTTPAIDWSAVLAAIADVRAAQERIFAADKVGERVDALGQRLDQRADELKAAIDSPSWVRSVMGNRYVQLAIVGLGSYAATHQAMK